MKISGAINDIQKEYNSLCDKGGGVGGGPNIQSVYDLIKHAGRKLNNLGHQEITRHLESFPGHNPWHICFAMGLCWGHLAKDELTWMIVYPSGIRSPLHDFLAAGFGITVIGNIHQNPELMEEA